jgi:hypothetical protein
MENMNENREGMSGQGMAMGMSRCWHWACCILPIVSLLMWLAGIFFVVLAWASVASLEGVVWGYGPQWWIWNAVMFGILAIFGGRAKMGCHCGSCMHGKGRGMCGCKPGCTCVAGKCVC